MGMVTSPRLDLHLHTFCSVDERINDIVLAICPFFFLVLNNKFTSDIAGLHGALSCNDDMLFIVSDSYIRKSSSIFRFSSHSANITFGNINVWSMTNRFSNEYPTIAMQVCNLYILTIWMKSKREVNIVLLFKLVMKLNIYWCNKGSHKTYEDHLNKCFNTFSQHR